RAVRYIILRALVHNDDDDETTPEIHPYIQAASSKKRKERE
ncbi:hypothetical protein TSAR_015891, partial [Trichomalopsis sarcophagae]